MELTVTSGQPVAKPLPDPSSPARVEIVDPTIGSGSPAFSYWAECECPGDCLRDHANE
jgi:hypothetical protein